MRRNQKGRRVADERTAPSGWRSPMLGGPVVFDPSVPTAAELVEATERTRGVTPRGGVTQPVEPSSVSG